MATAKATAAADHGSRRNDTHWKKRHRAVQQPIAPLRPATALLHSWHRLMCGIGGGKRWFCVVGIVNGRVYWISRKQNAGRVVHRHRPVTGERTLIQFDVAMGPMVIQFLLKVGNYALSFTTGECCCYPGLLVALPRQSPPSTRD
jgi:hypothetical protein